MRFDGFIFVLAIAMLSAGCASAPVPSTGPDPFSFSRHDEVVVRHIELDLSVDFDARRLIGSATLTIDNLTGADELWLDSWDLEIARIKLEPGMDETDFEIGAEQPYLGNPLRVTIRPDTRRVHIDYATGADPAALQWLTARQTAGRRHPFLLTQSETVYARSWVPCQDAPAVRFTYDATVRVPPGLMALMSAVNPTEPNPEGVYHLRMEQAIPSYLLALAVGDVEFRPIGPRSGVYAEPEVIERAAWEFAEAGAMLEQAESLVGPYRWERYDLIVLPPSFPWGGMENPRLTFVTPTLLAGDRSLVATVAHEIAHSWSGNLVTQTTWNDTWLNEGLTVYVEKRIMEAVYGREYSEMLALLDLELLRDTLTEHAAGDPDTHLRFNLAGRDPDDAFSDISYEKGYQFLRMLEEGYGREEWDPFLRRYFDKFAFGAVDTDTFVSFLDQELGARPELAIERWVDGPGLPDNAASIESAALAQVDRLRSEWLAGSLRAEQLDTTGWTTHHWLRLLRGLSGPLDLAQAEELDAAFDLSALGNAEILVEWLKVTIGSGHAPADEALERFLTGVGRLKYLAPLYERLIQPGMDPDRALAIYGEAREGYHPLAAGPIEELLGLADGP